VNQESEGKSSGIPLKPKNRLEWGTQPWCGNEGVRSQPLPQQISFLSENPD
jgi:hypothetical protein